MYKTIESEIITIGKDEKATVEVITHTTDVFHTQNQTLQLKHVGGKKFNLGPLPNSPNATINVTCIAQDNLLNCRDVQNNFNQYQKE